MPQQVIEKIRGLTEGISKPKVALLGLTYKPNVDDCRESPAVKIAMLLRELGFTVAAFDPLAKNQETVPLEAALQQADLTVLLVNHDAFADLDPQQLARLVRRKVVLDTRGVLDRARWEAAGFTVVVLGEGALPFAEEDAVYKIS
jgi:UDP-N-acetyl-D-mannosaminuronic acid dehydrogenase